MVETDKVTLVSQTNLYLASVKKSIDVFDADTLKKALRVVSKGVAAAPVFMAMGAGVKWLDTAAAKEDALKLIIELKKVMEKL